MAHVAEGEVEKGEMPLNPWKDRSLTAIGARLAGFPEAELAAIPSLELQALKTVSSRPASAAMPFALKTNSYRTLDFGKNLSGFIGARITARSRTRLFVTFDEILSNNDVDFKRLGCVNVVLYELEPGAYTVESFEPYTLRYLKFIVLEGQCEVADCYLRELANPEASRARFAASDERFNRIFEAARQTFRQNATDVFMDCPSRERAGWLCDSFFTARVAADLCGASTVEKNFFENYQRPVRFAFLPDGMLPMCYPSDHNDGVFIPNWAMWFVVQLEEYGIRSGDRELVELLRPRVLKLLDFFRQYENADGLLEKLPGWVFVEWSMANSFVQDVNYPSNMLYAGMLDAASRLYRRPDLATKAARIRETIRRQSFDGQFFADNAVRKDGKLQVTTNRTEVCQYFAFFFGAATPAMHPKLWQTLVNDFGAVQADQGISPNSRRQRLHWQPASLRTALAQRAQPADIGRGDRLLALYGRAHRYALGTRLAANQLQPRFRFPCRPRPLPATFLGLYRVDTVGKSLQLRFADVKLDWCRGSIPTPDGPIEIQWKKGGDKLTCRLASPAGYKVEIENRTGKTLEKE